MVGYAQRGLPDLHAPGGVVRLPCGRRLAHANLGAADGRPVLYFHGWPSSRLEAVLLHEAALKSRVRLIAVDRPGIGRSDPAPGRTLLDWPKDIALLADALGLDRFGIVAWSGGAPSAMACAFEMAQRLTAIISVGGAGPVDWPGATHHLSRAERHAARRASNGQQPAFMLRLWLRLAGATAKCLPGLALRGLSGGLCSSDKELLARPAIAEQLIASFREALRPGAAGLTEDLAISLGNWDFDLPALRCPIHVWHGSEDWAVDHAFGQHYAASVPEVSFRSFAGEGHLLMIARADENCC